MSLPAHALIATPNGGTPLAELPPRALLASDLHAHKPVVRVEAPESPVQRTLLRNGLTIDSSSEQRFLAVTGVSGEPVWTAQRDLKRGDRLLLACDRFDPPLDFEVARVNQPYAHAGLWAWEATEALVGDRRLWEMIGFALADGYFPAKRTSTDNFRMYAHDLDTLPLIDRFFDFCQDYDLDAVRISGSLPQLSVHHGPFQRWLRDLGFRSMNEGARFVPQGLLRLPAWMREAVLSGFMSAWGEWSEHAAVGTPFLHAQITDLGLTQGILRLFWSVGICAGIGQRGWGRAGNLIVGDVARYQRRTNFILPHKRRKVTRPPERDGKWDTITNRTANHLTGILKKTEGWSALHADERAKILRCGYNGSGLRRGLALQLFERVGAEPPTWLQYHHAEVDATREVEGRERMFDLSATDPLSPAYLVDFALTRGSRTR